jgi:hypothetical protein
MCIVVLGTFFVNAKRQHESERSLIQATPLPPHSDEVYPIHAIGNSGMDGTATYRELTSTTYLYLKFPTAPDDDEEIQPSFVKQGTCDDLGDTVFTLTVPDSGTSETDLELTIDQIHALGKLAVVITATKDDPTLIACGNLNTH